MDLTDVVIEPCEPQLTELVLGVSSSQCNLNNVNMNEEYFTAALICEDDIVAIDSNFGHKILPGYTAPKKVKNSNRGRRPQEKIKKPRKRSGDGSSFASMIQFTIRASHIRKIQVDENYHFDREIIPVDEETEKVTKTYKAKLFRNGKIIVPGSITEDMNDVKSVLYKLRDYLRKILLEEPESIEIVDLSATMRNYRTRLRCGSINIHKLFTHFVGNLSGIDNICMTDVEDLLLVPIFQKPQGRRNLDITGLCASYAKGGWYRLAQNFDYDDIKNLQIDFNSSLLVMRNSDKIRSILVNSKKLEAAMTESSLLEVYKLFLYFLKNTGKRVGPKGARYILDYMLRNKITEMEKYLKKCKENKFSRIRYHSETRDRIIVKVRTPYSENPDKTVTIKFFKSGRINIDSTISREQADHVYNWLNNLFYKDRADLVKENNGLVIPEYDSELSDQDDEAGLEQAKDDE